MRRSGIYLKEFFDFSNNKKSYFFYFCCKLGDQNKNKAPPLGYTRFSFKSIAWVNGNGSCIPFGVPKVWGVPRNHSLYHCYILWNVLEIKINTCVSEYTISKSACDSWRWPSRSWTSRHFCYALWWRRQCFFKRRRNAAIRFKRCRLLAKQSLVLV